jgi:4-hydroxy-tetrahydrodipicolinate reductase
MGKEVEKAASARGHFIIARLDSPDDWGRFIPAAGDSIVVIDFSTPESAYTAVNRCFDLGLPVVSGTTGWNDRLEQVSARCLRENRSFFYAPNFSIGVNIFFEINRTLSRLMENLQNYSASVHEIHHIHKLDAPSGTAIALASGIIDTNTRYNRWQPGTEKGKGLIPVSSERTGEIPGTHFVTWSGSADMIELKHTAHNRQGFAEGAVMAAEWIQGRTGMFGMADLLGLGQTSTKKH